MELGQLDEPVNWLRALALFEELDNLPGQSGVLNMLGMFAYFRGEWDKALELYKRAQATVHRTGNAVMDASTSATSERSPSTKAVSMRRSNTSRTPRASFAPRATGRGRPT